jgi:predicted  nucleic acid-binding Zn-ribbon protein
MEGLKQDLALLFELQNYDVKINNINNQISFAPSLIDEKNKILDEKKIELSEKKKRYLELLSLKKEKESLLDSKEKTINKHSLELNSVKSNDTYKSLLLAIEQAKADKGVLEDEILALMVNLEEESAKTKIAENEFQEFERNVRKEILDIDNNVKNLKEEVITLGKARDEYKLKINKSILQHYERLKEGRDGYGMAVVDGESCSGCGIVLRTQLVNQALKGQDLVFCDNCSRILFKK